MATSGDSTIVNGQLQSTSEAAKILKAGRLTKQGKITSKFVCNKIVMVSSHRCMHLHV